MSKDLFHKNVPNWHATADDYRLVFRFVDSEYWREISGNIPEFQNIILADYLAMIDLELPDGCQFCRVVRDDERIEFRLIGSIIRIDYRRL